MLQLDTIRRMLYILLVLALDWALNQETSTTSKPTTTTTTETFTTSTLTTVSTYNSSTTSTQISAFTEDLFHISTATTKIIETSVTSTASTASKAPKETSDGSYIINSTNASTQLTGCDQQSVEFTTLAKVIIAVVVLPTGIAVIIFCIIYAKSPSSKQDDEEHAQNDNNQDIRSDEKHAQHDNSQDIMSDTGHAQPENNQNIRSDLELTRLDTNRDIRRGVEGKAEDGSDTRTDKADKGHNEIPKNSEQLQSLAQDHEGSNKLKVDVDIFPKTKIQEDFIQNNPRSCEIIMWPVEKMTSYIGEKIGGGGFGTVYKANIPGETKCRFAIKEIHITEELFQKSYDKEIDYGRILHPFIIPIIARAESRQPMPETGISYIMYPYMENRDLRRNIDIVNLGNNLSPNESNEQIWSRCIYQIAQAMDFLHKPYSAVRGPIFHRDLTSRNILLDENFNVRIGDFGIAVEAGWNASHATMSVGTDGYYPPSMRTYKYIPSHDIFTIGVVMLEVLTGQEVKLKEEPRYLYKKYNFKGGYDYLKEDLDLRAEKNKAASWNNKDRRDTFAKIALSTVDVDGRQRTKINLLKKLEVMRLNAKERYQKPENLDRCVSCCVNPIVKLSTKGQQCIRDERENQCQYFCIHCLTNHHFNPLMCPQHGRTRPPFGDYVYGVFIAGNNVDDSQQLLSKHGPNHDTGVTAQMFMRDVQKVVNVLKATHPLVLGASENNLKVVIPKKPGTKDTMEPNVRTAFEELSDTIKQAILEKGLDPSKDRLPNSLFIFYFSGHCSIDTGLHLGSSEETLKASTPWIQEMLHTELGVEQVVIVLDCCDADSQKFIDTQGLNASANPKYNRKNPTIVQLSSCDVDQKSYGRLEGSYFTHFFYLGLLGLDSDDDMIKFCDQCEKHRTNRNVIDSRLPCGKYHNQCLSHNGVTMYALVDFIQGHFHLLRADTSHLGIMTLVHSAQREKEIYLAYYNPYKWHIPIHLKGSNISDIFRIYSDPFSMDQLRQDILKHIVKRKSHYELLSLHEYMGPDCSYLIAIHQRYGTDRNRELTSLDSVYKARFCGRELEAHVRENISGLAYGPVKLNKINATVSKTLETEINEDYLKINQNCIEIPIKSIKKTEKHLRKMKLASRKYPEDLTNLVQEISKIIRNLRTVDEGSLLKSKRDQVLKLSLYEEFSILTIE